MERKGEVRKAREGKEKRGKEREWKEMKGCVTYSTWKVNL
jgi:hypothetical protein